MEITDARYQELLSAENKAKTLEAENAKMKETAENTAIALKTHRETEGELKAKITEFETKLSEKDKLIAEKEEVLKTTSETAKKWNDYESKKAEEVKTNIEAMKTKLGDKLTDEHKNFIDGLDDNKVETYLKGLIPKEDNGKPPVIGEPPAGGKIDPNSNFEKALNAGDLTTAIANIK